MAALQYLCIRCWDEDHVGSSFLAPTPSPGPPVTELYNPKGKDGILGKYRQYVMEVVREGSRFFVLTKDYRCGLLTDNPNTTFDLNGDIAIRWFDDGVIVSGQYDDFDVEVVSALRITAPVGDYTLTGFLNGNNGKELLIYNDTAFVMTIAHENAGSAVANRIHTMEGMDIVLPGESMAQFKYDELQQRWILMWYSGQGKWNKIYRNTTRKVQFYSAGVVAKTFNEVMLYETYDAGTSRWVAQYGYAPQFDALLGSTYGCNVEALFHYKGTEHGNVYIDGLSPTGPNIPDYWFSGRVQFKNVTGNTDVDYREQGIMWSEDKGDFLLQRWGEVANPKRRIYVAGRIQFDRDFIGHVFSNLTWKTLASPEYQISDDECKNDTDLGLLGAARFAPILVGNGASIDIIWDKRFKPVSIMSQAWLEYMRASDDHVFGNAIDVQMGANPTRNQKCVSVPAPPSTIANCVNISFWLNNWAALAGTRHIIEANATDIDAIGPYVSAPLWHLDFWGYLEIVGEDAHLL